MRLETDSHPHVCPWSSTSVRAKSEAPSEVDPHQSNFALRRSPTDSLIYLNARKRPIRPSGMLIINTDRQLKLSIKGPPISGPNTDATANAADHMPSACARSFKSVNVTARIAIAVG